MLESEQKLLEENGWTVECEEPLKVRNVDGSFMEGSIAHEVVGLRLRRYMSAARDKELTGLIVCEQAGSDECHYSCDHAKPHMRNETRQPECCRDSVCYGRMVRCVSSG